MVVARASASLSRNLLHLSRRSNWTYVLDMAFGVAAFRESSRLILHHHRLSQVRQTQTMRRRRIIERSHCTASASASASSFASWASSCFHPSPVVDISEYLVNGCNWKEAPRCPDYIGPVYIGKTPDGRGRGLYAAKDVAAGDIIIISNAFAVSYNDTHSMELYARISAIIKQSTRALQQYYSLAGYDYHDEMEVPEINLFNLNVPFTETHPPQNLEIDEKRIAHILNVNSFEGNLVSGDGNPDTKLNGLWLVPSFINHSCCPNASRLVVGEAMFIIASQDIKAKEEVNISYTDAMSPVKRREDNLGCIGYGFYCECKRCVTERSIQENIRDISNRVNELYDAAGDEVLSAVSTIDKLPADKFPVCMELSDLYDKLRQRVQSMENLSKLQKQWILGSYSSAFLGKWLVTGYGTGFKPATDFVNSSALELVEAMKATVPGMLRTLSFTTILAHVAEKQEEQTFALVHGLVRLALDECVRVYGKQRLDVTMKLMEQSSDVVPFF